MEQYADNQYDAWTDEALRVSDPATGDRLLLRIDEAAARLGIGRTKLYELVMAGEVESVPVGRLRRIPSECLDEYVERLRARGGFPHSAA